MQTTTSGREDGVKHFAAHKTSFTSVLHSLEHDRPEPAYPEYLQKRVLGRALLAVMGAYSRKQQLRNGASVMYNAISEQAESEELHRGVALLQLPGTGLQQQGGGGAGAGAWSGQLRASLTAAAAAAAGPRHPCSLPCPSQAPAVLCPQPLAWIPAPS